MNFLIFLLEKRNYKSKQMTKGTFNNGEEIHESKDIIKDFFFFFFYEKVKLFYERLCYKRIED